ncbi:hypothetical protein AQUCO_01300420v1 [Aquilegia coerulea]|uniref:Uncharacterized protein n=1 Tax=Aquilegia coerulea TaxID=218851 RepID=A0A2G5E1P1_AQUCA|nr:hypothetical protein AQUCO_01300420v1 [Aquilegia coerulea]
MSTLDVTRAELALLVLYLNKAEARDKLCRAIQYGSKFIHNGEAGTAQNVDKSTSLARKVFRLFKFVNDLHALISPTPQGTPLPIVLLGKSKNALLSTFLFLDQIVWLGRTGIYKVLILLIEFVASCLWFSENIAIYLICLYRTKNVQNYLAGFLFSVGWAPLFAPLWLSLRNLEGCQNQ